MSFNQLCITSSFRIMLLTWNSVYSNIKINIIWWEYVPEIPFCSNKGTDSQNQIHPRLLNNLRKFDQIVSSLKRILQFFQYFIQLDWLLRLSLQSSKKKHIYTIAWTIYYTHIARRKLMTIPKHVRLNHIDPSFFRRLNQSRPHLSKHTFYIQYNLKTSKWHFFVVVAIS